MRAVTFKFAVVVAIMLASGCGAASKSPSSETNSPEPDSSYGELEALKAEVCPKVAAAAIPNSSCGLDSTAMAVGITYNSVEYPSAPPVAFSELKRKYPGVRLIPVEGEIRDNS